MADTETQTEEQRVEDWRRDEFVRLGVPFDQAVTLAGTKVDLAQFRALIDKGCDATTAVKILV